MGFWESKKTIEEYVINDKEKISRNLDEWIKVLNAEMKVALSMKKKMENAIDAALADKHIDGNEAKQIISIIEKISEEEEIKTTKLEYIENKDVTTINKILLKLRNHLGIKTT